MECPHPPFIPLAQTLAERLHAQPERCAIRFRGATISNAALLRKISALADNLHAAGIEPGMRAGVCLERSPMTPALLLALWWRGAVYVPLDPAFPRERLFTMCEIAELDVIITQPNLRRIVETLPCPVLRVDMEYDFDAQPLAAVPASDAPVTAGTLAYILFTSGSSGAPKGVKIKQGNLLAFFAAALPLLALTANCRVLCCANFCFDIALFELLAPLLCGGTLVLADDSACAAPIELLQLIEQEGVTLVQATPSHWQLLTALPWSAPLSIAISIGEALPRDTAVAIARHTRTLWNTYGPTECTIWASAHRVLPEDLVAAAPAIVSIGSALPGYTLRLEPVVTDTGTLAEELVISGAAVGVGYCANEQAAAFTSTPREHSYRSGDLCRRDAQGLLHYCGRRDSQAKHNGYRIEPEEIELLLRQHMSIRQAACCVRPATSQLPSLLFACVVFRRGMPNRGKRQLNEYLAACLPDWMLPQRYYFLDELPLNANGKLDRAALCALTESEAVSSPADALETRVAAVFCEVLDVDAIGYCDSFLDAGGSSMLAATLVMTLNERLGSHLTLRQALATPPTVNGIVQLLRAAPSAAS
jgi:amino acid adenylation domain-containing protein